MSTSHLQTPARGPRASQRGFSLIEILVGMVIAMIGVVIMMEVLLTSDQRTRTSSAGNDALSSGAVMLHMMQRDLVQGGYGINSLNLLGCNVVLPAGSGGATVPLVPVAINPATTLIPAGDANTDTMLVIYGNNAGQPEGNRIVAPPTGNAYPVQAATSFAEGDYVIAHPGNCASSLTLAQVTAATAATVTVDAVQAGATTLYNLGPNPRVVAYAVRNGSLTSCDFIRNDCRDDDASAWTAVVGNMVSLRAQYGRDTAPAGMDGVIDTWDQASPVNACGWARTSAVRFALVARSAQYESRVDPGTGQRDCDPVTALTPTWTGSTGTSTAVIDLSDTTDTASGWQCYRYRTFENIAPTRNVVWMGVQAGC